MKFVNFTKQNKIDELTKKLDETLKELNTRPNLAEVEQAQQDYDELLSSHLSLSEKTQVESDLWQEKQKNSNQEISQLKKEYKDLKVVNQKTTDKLTIEQQEYQNLYRLLDKELNKVIHERKQEQKKINDKLIRFSEKCLVLIHENNLLTQEKESLTSKLEKETKDLNTEKYLRLEKEQEITNLKTQLENKDIQYQKLASEKQTIQTNLENKEKQIIHELNSSLNLNLSEPTLFSIIACIKELIIKPPTDNIDNDRIKQLEHLASIKEVDLVGIEKSLGLELPAKIKQQFQSAKNCQELANYRYSFLKQHLANTSQTIQSPTELKQLKSQRNILLTLLIMNLLAISGLIA